MRRMELCQLSHLHEHPPQHRRREEERQGSADDSRTATFYHNFFNYYQLNDCGFFHFPEKGTGSVRVQLRATVEVEEG